MTALWDPLLGADAVAAELDDAAWVAALCSVEAALARAGAACGLFDPAVADRVVALCAATSLTDPGDLGRAAVADGNPVVPLVDRLKAAAGDDAHAVHLGATSQDLLDTATMLLSARAGHVVLGDLRECGNAAARLAGAHRTLPMMGRTLLQQAVPTTFGAVAAGWGAGLDRVAVGLAQAVARLPVSYGGAAGTMAAVHPHGPALRAALAAELELRDPGGTWHTDRTPVTELATALGVAASAVAKPATDVVLLAQTEIGEVREGSPGGSSAMAHKANPVAAITARAAAAQAPGLVATLLACVPELQRGAGAWHAEWPALQALLRYAGGGAARLRVSLTDLVVDPAAMARRVPPGHDLDHAVDLVDAYLAGRAA